MRSRIMPWIDCLFPRERRSLRANPSRLSLESLEDRLVPSAFNVNSVGVTLTPQNTIIARNSALVRPDLAPNDVPLWFTAMLDSKPQVPSNASPATDNATTLPSPDQSTLRLGISFVILERPPAAVATISGNIDYVNSGRSEQEEGLSGTVNPAPVITPSTTSLKLGTSTAGAAGSAQSYTVSGSNLTEAIIITAPMGVELSSDNGRSFHPLLTLTPANGTVATATIEARISASAGVGNISGKIRCTSSGAGEQEVSVSGTVNPVPTATPSTTSLDLGTAGTAQSYTVSGSNLTEAIIIPAPTGVELSSDNGSTFHPSLTLTQANGTVATDAGRASIGLTNLPQDGGTGDRPASLPAIITEVFLAIAIRANPGPALPDSKSGPRKRVWVRVPPSAEDRETRSPDFGYVATDPRSASFLPFRQIR